MSSLTLSLKWLDFCIEAGPDRCFDGAMLDCPGTFEQAFENATFLSLVIHIWKSTSFPQRPEDAVDNSQRHFKFMLSEEGFVKVLMKRFKVFMARFALYTSQSHIVFQIVPLQNFF